MPRLLDLFCGAGGAGMGYHRAGFHVVGVDVETQSRYPFDCIKADALELLASGNLDFDAIHASPPCQRFSSMTKRWKRSKSHPDLIEECRRLLLKIGKPFVIENVVGAPLRADLLLCGSMFSLRVRRHRVFECSFQVAERLPCNHAAQGKTIGVYGHAGGSSKRDGLRFSGTDQWREAMGIDWMTGKELAQAIPPAYTQYIGKLLVAALPRSTQGGALVSEFQPQSREGLQCSQLR